MIDYDAQRSPEWMLLLAAGSDRCFNALTAQEVGGEVQTRGLWADEPQHPANLQTMTVAVSTAAGYFLNCALVRSAPGGAALLSSLTARGRA